VPQDINQDSSAMSTLSGGMSPKLDKPPSPQAEKTTPDSLKPSSPKDAQGSLGTGGALTSPTCSSLDQDPADASSVLGPIKSPRTYPQAPSLMDSEPLVDLNVEKARLRHSLRRFRDNVHRS
jgi:hypothetical protein